MPLSIVEQDGRIAVRAPYHPNFPARARGLGGTWDAARRVWMFDVRDLDRVKLLCSEIYGTDGTMPTGERRWARAGTGISSPKGRPPCRIISVTGNGCDSV